MQTGGLFDPALNEWIFIDRKLAHKYDLLTCIEIHEGTHRAMFQSTTFGLYQQLLAILARVSPVAHKHPSVVSNQRLAMNNSWNSHEGIATFRGVMSQVWEKDDIFEMKRVMDLLPRDYLNAWFLYHFILLEIPKPFRERVARHYNLIWQLIPTAVATWCLNTPILEIAGDAEFVLSEDRVIDHFGYPSNSPDHRLRMVNSLATGAPSQFWEVALPVLEDQAGILEPILKAAVPSGASRVTVDYRSPEPFVKNVMDALDTATYQIARAIGSLFPNIKSAEYVGHDVDLMNNADSNLQARLLLDGIEAPLKYVDHKPNRSSWINMQSKRGEVSWLRELAV